MYMYSTCMKPSEKLSIALANFSMCDRKGPNYQIERLQDIQKLDQDSHSEELSATKMPNDPQNLSVKRKLCPDLCNILSKIWSIPKLCFHTFSVNLLALNQTEGFSSSEFAIK